MFDEMLMCSAGARRLSMRWSKNIPALVRMPLFSMATGFGYVVLYKEKVREYILQCFDPDTGGRNGRQMSGMVVMARMLSEKKL